LNRIAPSLSIYLGGQFLLAFAGVLGVIAGLIVLFDTIELLRRTVRTEGIELATVVGLALLKTPHTIEDVLPFVVMIAVMLALFRLSRHHELVVIRSAGASVWQVLAPSLALAVVIGVLGLAVFNPLAAGLYSVYERLKDGLIRNDAAALDIGETGFWLRESNGGGAAIVHAVAIRQTEAGLGLTGLTIIETDTKDNLVRRIEARDGQLLDGFFRLRDTLTLEPGKPAAREPELFQPTTITLTQVQESFASPETLSFWDLPEFIAFSQASGFSALPHRLHWMSLMTMPVMLCAMVMIAAAFFLTSQARLAGWTARGAGGVATGFLLFFFSRFTYALGLSAQLPVSLAAWAPATIALLLGLAYLFYREDG
jgi:lipopolysaccharide export system permease protein